jgi:hypothetical protein
MRYVASKEREIGMLSRKFSTAMFCLISFFTRQAFLAQPAQPWNALAEPPQQSIKSLSLIYQDAHGLVLLEIVVGQAVRPAILMRKERIHLRDEIGDCFIQVPTVDSSKDPSKAGCTYTLDFDDPY